MTKILKITLLILAFLAFQTPLVYATDSTPRSLPINTSPQQRCVVGQPCEGATPAQIRIGEKKYLGTTCGDYKCSAEEYCFNSKAEGNKCLPIKDNYCGGGGLESKYQAKPCLAPDYSCLPVLLGSKEDLPRVCIRVSQGEVKKVKVEIREIPSTTGIGEPSYLIKTERVEVVSKIKVETDEKDQIKAVPDAKKISQPMVLLSPEEIIDKLIIKPEQIVLDIACDKANKCRPAYDIRTTNTTKFLGVLSISYSTTQSVDATTARALKETKPWFIHLAPFLFR